MSYDYEKSEKESDKRKKLWGIDWPGHPDADKTRPNVVEKSLMEEPEAWQLLKVTDDPDADYSYDSLALLVRGRDGLYALIRTSGCSCPSPTETWGEVASGNILDIVNAIDIEIKSWGGEKRWFTGPYPEMETFIKTIN